MQFAVASRIVNTVFDAILDYIQRCNGVFLQLSILWVQRSFSACFINIYFSEIEYYFNCSFFI